MPTPHIEAQPGDFADTVLMPGDPLRARMIAEHHLEDAQQVTGVRNMLGFTGTYQGRRISVMGSGMGIPSLSIYAHELYTQYDVKRIIRVGSCGSVKPEIGLRDIVIAMGACTDSVVNRKRFGGFDYAAIADFELLQAAVATANSQNIPVRVGNVFSADLFYEPNNIAFESMQAMGVLAVEMEAAGLYGLAASLNRQALAVLTVSDHLLTSEHLSPEARQEDFHQMVKLVLDTVISN
ncbi:purine-nucleoside phosphorylase [Pseudomonas asuensis]|uniref:Purine nucleoside phosphorylase DeoD-type n=1 Tax=Pseudomonas asuensis TaxID=1825787 RepID=A0ABQ2H3Q6_9PSED|nr:purine-nucleoside phosphorylase [Pseudomonas asuensis]GGM28858.1 purine nucleoside phosphorylase DeoD-type 2 [Pseudomonas asuensis]